MHTATKVMLILGGIITVIGLVMYFGGAAAAEYDPIGDSEWDGKTGTFDGSSDAWYSVYAETSSCDNIDATILDADGEEAVYDFECNDDSYDADGYIHVGTLGGSGPWTIDSSHTLYISDTGEELGEAAGGFMAMLGSFGVLCCGGFFLLLGGIFALTLKEGGDTVVVVQGGAQQPMMAATGMAAPQYEQPVQYQQPPQGGM